MNWAAGMQRAIDYIEDNITGELDYGEIARAAYSSSFHFQRVFGILCGCTLGEYIRMRRLTLAGGELAASNARVLDVALKYGYDTPESFGRAFARFHGITPSQARLGGAQLKSFSRLSVKLVLEGGTIMDYRIEHRDAFQVLARKKRFAVGESDVGSLLSGFWSDCTQDGSISALCAAIGPEDPFGGALLGICFDDPQAGDFDYAIGAAYQGGEVPRGLSLETIPAFTWAVFPCKGAMPAAFENLYRRIYTEFFPTSEYQLAGGACLEAYPSDDVTSEDYACEIWLSVEKK